jgi:N-acetylneuraminic acid mutarotase
MRSVYRRRRIVAGIVVIGIPLLLIVLLLRRGSGGSSNKVASSASTTSLRATTTTAPPQLVVAATSWSLPEALSRSVVLPVGTNVGIFGGLTAGGVSSRNVYQVDPTNGMSTTAGTMASPVHDAAGAVIAGSYFIFGGGGTTETAAVQKFTAAAPNHLTGSLAGNLPAKRADLTVATENGHTYLVGGYDGSKWLAPVLDTTDGGAFITVAQLNPAVRYPAVAALNGKLYVIGGELSPNEADANNVQVIDLKSFAVTQLGPLPEALSHAAAAVLDGTIYVFGGRSMGHAVDTISVFNTTTGQLNPVGHLPAARSDMGVGVVGQTVYLIGGEGDNGKPVSSVVTAHLSSAGG